MIAINCVLSNFIVNKKSLAFSNKYINRNSEKYTILKLLDGFGEKLDATSVG